MACWCFPSQQLLSWGFIIFLIMWSPQSPNVSAKEPCCSLLFRSQRTHSWLPFLLSTRLSAVTVSRTISAVRFCFEETNRMGPGLSLQATWRHQVWDACLVGDSRKTSKFYWQRGFRESLLQLQIRHSGRETIRMIPLEFEKCSVAFLPLLIYLRDFSLLAGALSFILCSGAVVSSKTGRVGQREDLEHSCGWGQHHFGLWPGPPKARQDTGKALLTKSWSEKTMGITSVK